MGFGACAARTRYGDTDTRARHSGDTGLRVWGLGEGLSEGFCTEGLCLDERSCGVRTCCRECSGGVVFWWGDQRVFLSLYCAKVEKLFVQSTSTIIIITGIILIEDRNYSNYLDSNISYHTESIFIIHNINSCTQT